MALTETCIERYGDESFCTVYTSELKFMNKLLALKEQYPNEVTILQTLTDPTDKSMRAYVPANWMKFVGPPKKINLTDEERKARGARLKASKNKEEPNDT